MTKPHRHAAIAAALVLSPIPAHAEDRDFCADRPGAGTPACTLAPGRAMIEIGVGQWSHDSDAQTITDTATLAETLFRLGVTNTLELQFGLGGHVTNRVRDRASGLVDRARGIGDGYIALRQSISSANGPVAIQAFVTLPFEKSPVGAGDWGAGVLIPASVKLPAGFELALTPEVDAAVDGDGSGRHLAYGGVIGVSHDLGKTLTLEIEGVAFRDNDPAGHATDASVVASLAWQVAKEWQVDFQVDAGLTEAAPGRVFTLGFAHRF